MESRYRYQVTPYSPIKDLIPGQSLRRPFTSDLTKDEVLLCMKHGPVSRLFPGKLPIKVTGSNIDNLHKKDFEGDFVDVASIDTENDKKVEIEQPKVTEESKTEVPTEVNSAENSVEETNVVTNDEEVSEEPVEVESVVEEPQVVEETIEESTPAEEVKPEAQIDDTAEAQESQEPSEDVEEVETEEDEEGETLSVDDEEDSDEEEESGEQSTPVSANNYNQQNRNKKKKRH